jgi:predicted signal transduction protein with EAL and GGDEF domain
VATRLLASLAQVSVFGQDGASEPLKASVAIVCFPEDGTTSKDLLESAMGDLMQAKREREELAKTQVKAGINPLARAANDRR